MGERQTGREKRGEITRSKKHSRRLESTAGVHGLPFRWLASRSRRIQRSSIRRDFHLAVMFLRMVLRGAIVSRTYVIHKNLYIYLILLTIFGPIYYGPT